ncbi:NAD-dependent malic enzyme [Hyphococcus flavus]|uniref:NAD-dependent malic enzyme n=1 Tax=Hyphococcus flavus TaxID=1866326 RepID=A0AAE9ZBQ8_9PROT|nr:malic enzyme-like NAD(P)-binding protein [Hyphococcus flavus]WDI30365.1 NAD-dependent malic enzyme [Hyphococcus flavus]
MFNKLFNSIRRGRRSSYAALYEARAKEKAPPSRSLDEAALDYHRAAPAGKMECVPTKPMSTQRDLSLAYSPGVAAACREIERDPSASRTLTNRANLVAIVTNGTAVLGLGDIGAEASKPVMEGKAALFKRFAGVDAIDLCVDETDPAKLADLIVKVQAGFGGFNLEDIKAPQCFEVERLARERTKVPVFHDDQHGTGVCVLAGLLNALELTGRALSETKIAVSGAGAAAIACVELLVAGGAQKENILLTDSMGVVYKGRKKGMTGKKADYAVKTDKRTLADAVEGADFFLGVSRRGLLTPDMVRTMAESPIIFALANPEPEIWPEDALDAAPGAIIATGRSDYPNQVNNVLCFPFLFRGALDVSASTVTPGMTTAAARAIGAVARMETPQSVRNAYPDENFAFGPGYILPKAFDPRLLPEVAGAVAQAAMDDGVAKAPIRDMNGYKQRLEALATALQAL